MYVYVHTYMFDNTHETLQCTNTCIYIYYEIYTYTNIFDDAINRIFLGCTRRLLASFALSSNMQYFLKIYPITIHICIYIYIFMYLYYCKLTHIHNLGCTRRLWASFTLSSNTHNSQNTAYNSTCMYTCS